MSKFDKPKPTKQKLMLKQLGITGLALMAIAVTATASAQNFSKPPFKGYEKISEEKDTRNYLKQDTVKVFNQRKKVVGFKIYSVSKKDADATEIKYFVFPYRADCKTGEVTSAKGYGYNLSNVMIFIDKKDSEIINVSDDSPMGRLRDRICKKFGF